MSVEIIRTYLSLAREQLATKDYLAAINNYLNVIHQLQSNPLIINVKTRFLLSECYLDLADCYLCIDQQQLYLDSMHNGALNIETITIVELNSLSQEDLDFYYKYLIRYYKEDRILFSGDMRSKYTHLYQRMGFLLRYNDLPKDKTNRYASYLFYLCHLLGAKLNYYDPTLLPFRIHFAESIVFKTDEDRVILADAYHDMALVYDQENNKLSAETCCLRSLDYRLSVSRKVSEEYKLMGETYRILARQYAHLSLNQYFYQICEQTLSDYDDFDEDIEQLNMNPSYLSLPSFNIATVLQVFSQIDQCQITLQLLFKHKQQFLQLLSQTATDDEFPNTLLREEILHHYFPQIFTPQLPINESLRENSPVKLNASPLATDSPILASQHTVNISDSDNNAVSRIHDIDDLSRRMMRFVSWSKL